MTSAPPARPSVLERIDRLPDLALIVGSIGVVLALVAVAGLVRTTVAPTDRHELVDLSDDFEGDGSLLERGDDHPWTGDGGWTTERGAAGYSEVVAGQPNLAVVDLGSTDGIVGAVGENILDGWGLVFRLVDERTYWAVVAVPSLGGYVLEQHQQGVATVRGRVPLATAADGTELGVRFKGERIVVLLDGNVVLRVEDPEVPDDATSVGLFGSGGRAASSRWTDFYARASVDAD